MKTLAAGVALAALMTAPALAADLGGSYKDGPADYSAPVMVNWSGFYIGGRLGYGNANHDLNTELYVNETEEEAGETFTLFGTDGLNSAGVIGGGQLGYDFARGRYLFGVFGSYDLSGMETDVTFFDETTTSIEKGDEWSVGARAGLIVAPRTLAYILAAYTQTEYTFAGLGEEGSDKDVTFEGVTVGGGVEFAMAGNIFLGLEATHTFYGKESLFDIGDDEGGIRKSDELDETKVMGTLKIKLNSFGD